MNDRYTFLMSVYYKEKPEFLKISIESMLNQTIPAEKIIIVMDGSLPEELEKILNSFCDRYPLLFKIVAIEKNVGLGLALNRGIQEVQTELIARMDSDDYIIPQRCEMQLQKFKEDPELEIVGSFEAEFINEIHNVVSIHKVPETHEAINKFMKRRCAVLHPTVMFKKKSVLAAGNYQDVPLYEDYDLFARMILENNAKSYNIQENLYFIRTDENFWYRRGGIQYLKTSVCFKWKQYMKRNISLIDFCISGLGQAVICIMPNKMRRLFYLHILRD